MHLEYWPEDHLALLLFFVFFIFCPYNSSDRPESLPGALYRRGSVVDRCLAVRGKTEAKVACINRCICEEKTLAVK